MTNPLKKPDALPLYALLLKAEERAENLVSKDPSDRDADACLDYIRRAKGEQHRERMKQKNKS